MELNDKYKVKIAMLYIGSKFVVSQNDGNKEICILSGITQSKSNGVSFWDEFGSGYGKAFDKHLILRTISQLTDDEAAEVSKICYANDSELGPMSNPTENTIRGIRVWTGKTLSDLRGVTGAELHNMNGQKLSAVFQYLISIGIAVPLFFAPGHLANGLTALDLQLAINQTESAG